MTPDELKPEFIRLEKQLIDAMRKPDLSFLEKIFSDTYVYIGSDGRTWGKDKALEDFKDPAFKLHKLEISNNRILMHENTAIVTGISIVKGYVGNETITGKYQFMRVWNRSKNRWKVIAVYTSNKK